MCKPPLVPYEKNQKSTNQKKKKKIHSFFSYVILKCVTLFLVLLTAVKLEQADRRPSALRRVYVHVTTTTSTESAIYHYCQLLSTTTAIVYHYYYYRYYHYYYHYYYYYYQSCYVSSWTNRTNRESALAGVTSLAEVLE